VRRAVEAITSPEIVVFIWKDYTQGEFESDDPRCPAEDLSWIYAHPGEVMYLAAAEESKFQRLLHKAIPRNTESQSRNGFDKEVILERLIFKLSDLVLRTYLNLHE